MRVNDNVKEKAMTKLKEIKAKSEDWFKSTPIS